jgi:outer membrane lipoprotein SlyB
MAKTVLGVFNSVDQAEKAADELQKKGFNKDEISIVAKETSANRGGGDRDRDTMNQDLSQGVSTGGAIGGAAGLLAGIGALAIPGIGPIIAAGPIAAALTGAVTGGVAGGLLDWGVPEDTGRKYEEKVKEGKIVAAVKTGDDKVQDVADILRRNGAFDVETH